MARCQGTATQNPLRAGWLDWAREALTATLVAQILALPLILYQFGNLSVIAPIANVIMLPFVPSAMLFGPIVLVGGMAWLTEGARMFATMPYAAVQLPPFPLWVLLGYYVIVVGGWLWVTAWPAPPA